MSEISELIAFAKANTASTESKEISLGIIPNWQGQKIASSSGVQVKGAKKILSAYAVTHIFKRHGNNSEEQKNGQIGTSDTDIACDL